VRAPECRTFVASRARERTARTDGQRLLAVRTQYMG
jgi:hypothetical protein